MNLNLEPFRKTIMPNGILPLPDDAIEEYVDLGLEQLNIQHAEEIALLVRQQGKYKHKYENSNVGQWAEYKGVLPDGRSVFLQASEDALVVNISGTGKVALNEHAVWDRKQNIVNTFDQRDPARNNKAIMYYQVAPRSERIPETLTHFEVSHRFASMLGQIEQVILQ